jgi:hypothetical protein
MEQSLKIQFANGEIFYVPTRIIAENRANSYCSIDGYDEGSSEWEAEVEFAMDSEFEIEDWVKNNMNWSDLEPYARKADPDDFDYENGWMDAEIEIC